MKTAKIIITVFLMLMSGVTMAQNGKWFPVGPPGMSSGVYAMAFNGDTLYVGGAFTTAGGNSAKRIARWDGTNWTTLSTGFDGTILALEVSGGVLYAGGGFSQAGGHTILGIAKWDGTDWDSLGSGLDGGVRTIAVDGNDLYIGGSFTTVGGITAKGIARWNGTSWSNLGTADHHDNHNIALLGGNIYIVGTFPNPGGYTGVWNGASWASLGSGVNSDAYVAEVMGNDLYVGGVFVTAGGNTAKRIAKWDGTNWSNLGGGVSGPAAQTVQGLETVGNYLYVGGSFTTAGGVTANNIARWDGTEWDSLEAGVNGRVRVIVYHKNNLYVGGDFTTAGGVTANRVARYVFAPTSPYGLTSSVPGTGTVSLNWADSSDYEDGFVIERKDDTDTNWTVIDTTGAGIVMYNDSGLTSGTYQYRVYSFNEGGNSGYSDTAMATIPVHPLPPNSLSLNVLDTGIVKLTWADSSSNEDGFVLERKDNIDTNWTTIDSLKADSVTYTDTGLTVGRTYEWRVYAYNAGGNSGYSNVVSSLITGITGNGSLPDKYALYNNYPNPFNPSTKIKFDIPKSGIVKLTIYDILGRQVSTLVNNELTAGRYEMEWNAGSYSSGIYFYRIEADGFTEVKRMMLVK